MPLPPTPIQHVEVNVRTIPTDQLESDGTLKWNETTVVLVELVAGGEVGLGYTFSDSSAAALIRYQLGPLLLGKDALAVPSLHAQLVAAVRNVGRQGIASSAISALDVALWDLKARLLQVPLTTLFGAARQHVPVYGSGGFTSYSLAALRRHVEDFVDLGLRRVKIKVGRDPSQDVQRVRTAREALGAGVTLMVDANGAYDRKQALAAADQFASLGVDWFEEPVSSDDVPGLALLRNRCPAPIEITAGEYGYDLFHFRRLLEAQAVDVMQCDATRCLGYTGFIAVVAPCKAFNIPISAHTAPHLHLPCCMAIEGVRHIEYFHDHARIAEQLFEGIRTPIDGALTPDLSVAGHGIRLKRTPEIARSFA